MEAEKKSLPSTSGTQSFAESVIARKKAEEMARRAEEEEDEVEREAAAEPEEQQEAAAMDEGPMDPREAADMALAVAMEMEEKRKREAAERGEDDSDSDGQEGDDEGVVYSLDEITASMQKGAHPGAVKGLTKVQGPQEDAAVAAANERASKDLLDSYWQFVRENPNDFQGWTYLIQHVENIDDLDEVRTAYNAFLPLYPYCFAYWQRYSEIEKKHEKWQRALAILHRGLEAIPLSVDLWVSYLELYKKMYVDNADFADLFRQQCERAVQTVGLEYRSDVLWERYVDDIRQASKANSDLGFHLLVLNTTLVCSQVRGVGGGAGRPQVDHGHPEARRRHPHQDVQQALGQLHRAHPGPSPEGHPRLRRVRGAEKGDLR